MVLIIIKRENTKKNAWYNAWIDKEFTYDQSYAHTDTEFAVMKLPTGENQESPEGFFMVPKDKCDVWYYPCDQICLEQKLIGSDIDICSDGCVQAIKINAEKIADYLNK